MFLRNIKILITYFVNQRVVFLLSKLQINSVILHCFYKTPDKIIASELFVFSLDNNRNKAIHLKQQSSIFSSTKRQYYLLVRVSESNYTELGKWNYLNIIELDYSI